MSWFIRLLAPKRYVVLEMYDGDMVIVKAHQSQAGWMARWISNSDAWSILNPDGTTTGTALVKRWRPYSGWSK